MFLPSSIPYRIRCFRKLDFFQSTGERVGVGVRWGYRDASDTTQPYAIFAIRMRRNSVTTEVKLWKILTVKYVVGSKSFRPDQLFKVTEIKQLCYFSTVSLYFNTLFNWYINLTIGGTIYPSQHFPFGAAFLCQAGNFWTLLRIINYIKAQRLRRLGQVQRMTNNRVVKNYMNGNRYLHDCQEDQNLDGKMI